MATVISKNLPSNLTGQNLINSLRRKAPKKESSTNFVGLQRALALADLESSGKALNNILKKISLLDTLESQQYGSPYDAIDWNVTKDFLPEGIDKDFLTQLAGASIGGGSLGSTVSINPRTRIQDRLNFLNSFYGEGSFPDIHSGFDGQFYKSPKPKVVGYAKFTFNDTTGVITVTELKAPDGTTSTSAGALLGSETAIVFNIPEYTTDGGSKVSLEGLFAEVKLVNPNTWTINGYEDLSDSEKEENPIRQVKETVGSSSFGSLKFKLTRPYSYRFIPKWFLESPNDSSEQIAESADDINPATSSRILANQGGTLLPYIEKGYWFTKAQVETRWTDAERSRLTANGQNNTIVPQDSNMRWQLPPSKLRNQTYNWGVRWDGYLKITPGIYAFEVQTNVAVRIDMAINSNASWAQVFNTSGASAKEGEQLYISSASFSTASLNDQYKYKTGLGADDWIAYVPITIRLYHGAPDRLTPEYEIPSEPNLFIKTATLSSAKTYYSQSHQVTLAGTDGDWTITSPTSSAILGVLGDASASVLYRLTESVSVVEGETIASIIDPPLSIALSNVSGVIKSTTTGLTAGTYTLRILTNRGFTDLTALWKGRVASPSVTHRKYADLIDNSYIPDQQRISFDERPEWWKVSEGHPYNLLQTPSESNTPLDGFVVNSFKSTLKSNATGIGLYGNGSGTFSSKPNMILGEARYNVNLAKGSNYVGIRLKPNKLGEGGKVIVDAFPANNASFSDSTLLGQNDLGGGTNHETIVAANLSKKVKQMYLWTNPTLPSPGGYNNKYYLQQDLETLTVDDDPVAIGLPAFSDPDWLSPISIFAIRSATDLAFTQDVVVFGAPLIMTVQKVTIGARTLMSFSTTVANILSDGSELSKFDGQFIEFYTQNDIAFQFSRVDTGTALSFGDVLKMTYTAGVFQAFESEAPQADRSGPFGYDQPEFSSGLCYPPYNTTNPFLTGTVVDDTALYAAPVGNYDVLWGNPVASDLGGNKLTLSEKIEFQFPTGETTVVEPVTQALNLPLGSYTHKFRIDMPVIGTYDPDMLEHVGNGEKVKDSYYAFVKI